MLDILPQRMTDEKLREVIIQATEYWPSHAKMEPDEKMEPDAKKRKLEAGSHAGPA